MSWWKGRDGNDMKIIGVIPARYQSSRFPGKPLADICGKPMLWWVYNNVNKIRAFDSVICAIDDPKIQEMCENLGMRYLMTSAGHPNHISRVHEVSEKISADYYLCINGDEPAVAEECIIQVIPEKLSTEPYFGGAMRRLTDPAETLDSANIKLIVSEKTGRCLYMSRAAIPYPKGSLDISYKKYVGIECFNKQALDFFVNTPMGELEKIEDIDHLRFLEHGIELHFNFVHSDSISVDTPKDLEVVRKMMEAYLVS